MILRSSKYFILTRAYLPPLGIIIFGLSVLYLLLFSPYFSLSHVSCSQDVESACQNPHLVAEVDGLKGSNLLRLDTTSLATRLKRGDPTIRSLTLRKVLPNQLEIQILSAYARLALTDDLGSRYLIVDQTYRIMDEATTSPNVPTLVLTQPSYLRLGQLIEDQAFRDVCDATVTLFHALPSVQSVKQTDSYTLTLSLTDSRLAIMTLSRPLPPQIAALHALLQDDTISLSATEFDLRYNQPVIR